MNAIRDRPLERIAVKKLSYTKLSLIKIMNKKARKDSFQNVRIRFLLAQYVLQHCYHHQLKRCSFEMNERIIFKI